MTSESPKPSTLDYLHLHFLVIIWGFTAILGKLINADLSRISLTFFRTTLAALGLMLLLWWHRELKILPQKVRLAMVGVGILMGIHWLTFFASAHVSSVSVCLAGMSTTSLFTALLEPLAHKRPIKPLEIAMSLVVMVGLYIIFRFQFDQAVGLSLAIVSAFLAAVFTILNSQFVKSYNPLLIAFYEMWGGSLGMLVAIIGLALYKDLPAEAIIPQPTDWIWLFILAFVCTVYAYSAGIFLLRKISAFSLNLAVNLEPVYGMLLAYLIFGERMSTGFYAGATIILVAVILYPILNSLLKEKVK